ncbi:MAG TPA: hypothetical protein RMG48_14050, partial [Myxococcales bacterium LLY-WYZ-16_1]|nr:hypothetical protein [Myxococcales bacterium LLY-WYZ-16_1]
PLDHLAAVSSAALGAFWWAALGLFPCLLGAALLVRGADSLRARRSNLNRPGHPRRELVAPAVLLAATTHAISAWIALEALWRVIP